VCWYQIRRGGCAGGRSRRAGPATRPVADSAPATRRHSLPPRCSRGESEALTRTAVELALAGDPTAMRLCIERILPPCRERAVKFSLPPIESTDDISAAMQAVTAALARGQITPGEAATIAGVVDTFARAIDTTKRRGFAVDPLQILALGDYDETGGYDETDEDNETEDCDS
jgi:hypothetical protein